MKSIDNKFIKSFESMMYELLPSKGDSIHVAIHKSVESTNMWLNGLPAPTSELNIRMYFVQELSGLIPVHEVLQNQEFLSALLNNVGAKKVGDFVELHGEKWEVVWRKLGENFGIELGLKSSSSKTISHEFFD